MKLCPACGQPEPRSLTEVRFLPAELRLARYLLGTMPAKELAAVLRISVNTLKTYRGRIYSRCGVHSRGELRARWRP